MYICVIINLLILLFIFYVTWVIINDFYNQREYFTEHLKSNYDKTIFLVWNNKLKDSKTIHGFGDKIRGAIFLYQYCKKHKINLKINGENDVCGDYLVNVKDALNQPLEPLIIANNTKLYNTQESVITKQLENKTEIYIYTNDFPIQEMNKDDKKFAKYLCKPTKSLKNKVNEKIKTLPENYGIKHFRFNDSVLTNDIDINNDLFKKAFDILKNNYKPTDVLISNSVNFKKYAIDKLNIKTIDGATTKIKHIGENNDNGVEYSFIEFFICCKAKYINTHTTYNWPSNFVLWSSKIYNIPFSNIFLQN